ncbi:MAG TPA: ABC transporter ATP-binding protein [Nitrososphaerales archaeon]|nr:ABC transporter ATP-binding protein [Nitrososphaerales archaeon]
MADRLTNNHDYAISVDGLSHTYDGKKYVVDDISFKVRTGEIFGLLGRNGAGKTTTIKILTTLVQATKGDVQILGHDLRKEGSKVRKRIGVVQQDNSFDFATVRQNLDIYGFLWGVPKEIRAKRSAELMKMFGLEELAKMRAFDLSGGQQRRLQVAREFIHDMDLLFLDEPTVGLDPLMRRQTLDLLKERARRDGLSILFTTHNLEEADYICDRVAIMDQGRFQALDTVDNLKRRYGGTKAIELSLAQTNGVNPSYVKFFDRLSQIHADIEITREPTGSEPALIVSREPEKVIETIIAVASEQKAKIEWLNIRKSTLEDVFIHTVSSSEAERSGNHKSEEGAVSIPEVNSLHRVPSRTL